MWDSGFSSYALALSGCGILAINSVFQTCQQICNVEANNHGVLEIISLVKESRSSPRLSCGEPRTAPFFRGVPTKSRLCHHGLLATGNLKDTPPVLLMRLFSPANDGDPELLYTAVSILIGVALFWFGLSWAEAG